MTLKRYVGLVAVTAIVLVAFNVVIHLLAVNAAPRQLIQRIRQEPRVDVLFLGDSTVDSGCHVGTFRGVWSSVTGEQISPFNAALRASSAVEHDLVLRQTLKQHPHPKWVVYGFWDLKLTQPKSGSWTNLIGNSAMGYYIEPDVAASLYAPSSALASWRFRLTGWVPMLSERLAMWMKVERLRRLFGEIGMPRQAVNEFGRVADFESLLPPSVGEFTRNCDEAVRSQTPLWTPVREIIALSKAAGAKVAFVEMPMTPRNRQLFYSTDAWKKYRGYLQPLIQREGVVYVDANDWVPEADCFADTRHLNRQGAVIFTERLARTLAPQNR